MNRSLTLCACLCSLPFYAHATTTSEQKRTELSVKILHVIMSAAPVGARPLIEKHLLFPRLGERAPVALLTQQPMSNPQTDSLIPGEILTALAQSPAVQIRLYMLARMAHRHLYQRNHASALPTLIEELEKAFRPPATASSLLDVDNADMGAPFVHWRTEYHLWRQFNQPPLNTLGIKLLDVYSAGPGASGIKVYFKNKEARDHAISCKALPGAVWDINGRLWPLRIAKQFWRLTPYALRLSPSEEQSATIQMNVFRAKPHENSDRLLRGGLSAIWPPVDPKLLNAGPTAAQELPPVELSLWKQLKDSEVSGPVSMSVWEGLHPLIFMEFGSLGHLWQAAAGRLLPRTITGQSGTYMIVPRVLNFIHSVKPSKATSPSSRGQLY